MRRRRFLTALSGAAAFPLPALAQPKAMPLIGFLSGTAPELYAPFLAAFRDGLQSTGLVENRDVAIDYRWARGEFDRLPQLAAELVARKVDLIVTSGSTLAAQAAKQATDTIPTVFITGDDPVATGIVASLAHPGGNRTGISFLVVDLNEKRFELLCELLPHPKRIGLLLNPRNRAAADRTERLVREAARAKEVEVPVLTASTPREIEAAFAAFAERQVDGLLIGNDAYFNAQRALFIELAAHRKMPAIYESRAAVAAGGLINYGPSFPAMYRELGLYAGKILKGAKPADLPVEQPTKFELVINLKTATALDLNVPPALLARADEVIE